MYSSGTEDSGLRSLRTAMIICSSTSLELSWRNAFENIFSFQWNSNQIFTCCARWTLLLATLSGDSNNRFLESMFATFMSKRYMSSLGPAIAPSNCHGDNSRKFKCYDGCPVRLFPTEVSTELACSKSKKTSSSSWMFEFASAILPRWMSPCTIPSLFNRSSKFTDLERSLSILLFSSRDASLLRIDENM